MSIVNAIIFDLDGVLVNTIDMHYQAWRQVAKAGGRDLTRAEMEALRGVRRTECLQLLFPDMTLTPEKIDHFLQIKNTSFLDTLDNRAPDDILMDNAVHLIDSARDMGLKLGIASSSVNANRVLDQVELSHKFDIIADGLAVNRSKPKPDIFVWVAGALGVYPQHVIVFEDSVAGIRGAKQAGMTVVGVANSETESHADTYYDRLEQIDLDLLLQDLDMTVEQYQPKELIGDNNARD